MQFSVAMNKTAIRCISRGYRIRLGTGVDVFFFMFDHIHTRLFSCLKYLQYYGICGILQNLLKINKPSMDGIVNLSRCQSVSMIYTSTHFAFLSFSSDWSFPFLHMCFFFSSHMSTYVLSLFTLGSFLLSTLGFSFWIFPLFLVHSSLFVHTIYSADFFAINHHSSPSHLQSQSPSSSVEIENSVLVENFSSSFNLFNF